MTIARQAWSSVIFAISCVLSFRDRLFAVSGKIHKRCGALLRLRPSCHSFFSFLLNFSDFAGGATSMFQQLARHKGFYNLLPAWPSRREQIIAASGPHDPAGIEV